MLAQFWNCRIFMRAWMEYSSICNVFFLYQLNIKTVLPNTSCCCAAPRVTIEAIYNVHLFHTCYWLVGWLMGYLLRRISHMNSITKPRVPRVAAVAIFLTISHSPRSHSTCIRCLCKSDYGVTGPDSIRYSLRLENVTRGLGFIETYRDRSIRSV